MWQPAPPSISALSRSKVIFSNHDTYNVSFCNYKDKTIIINYNNTNTRCPKISCTRFGIYLILLASTSYIIKWSLIILKLVYSRFWEWKLHSLFKYPNFPGMQLQSGIVMINRAFILGLVTSIITAAMAYGMRLVLLNCLEFDVFTNLDNWPVGLSYFCSLSVIRFVLIGCLKENTFLMSYCGGPMGVTNYTAGSASLPVGGNAAGNNYSMQAPDHPGTDNSSGGGTSNTNDPSKLQELIQI